MVGPVAQIEKLAERRHRTGAGAIEDMPRHFVVQRRARREHLLEIFEALFVDGARIDGVVVRDGDVASWSMVLPRLGDTACRIGVSVGGCSRASADAHQRARLSSNSRNGSESGRGRGQPRLHRRPLPLLRAHSRATTRRQRRRRCSAERCSISARSVSAIDHSSNNCVAPTGNIASTNAHRRSASPCAASVSGVVSGAPNTAVVGRASRNAPRSLRSQA